jgi:hypothetical protein
VTAVGTRAFYSCYALKNITVPTTVQSFGSEAFYSASSIQRVYITDLEKWCEISFADDYATPLCYGTLYVNGEPISELVIPESVTVVKANSFAGGTQFVKITIPSSVTVIEKNAFAYCTNLKTITIPASVTKIGNGAFTRCTSLESVILQGEETTSFGTSAFYKCDSLIEVHVNSIEAWMNFTFANYDANPLYYAGNLFVGGALVTELVIPSLEDYTIITNYQFSGCKNITSLVIPEGYAIIGQHAFYKCTDLKLVVIPSTVQEIFSYAFYGCNAITEICYNGSAESWGSSIVIGNYNTPISNATRYYYLDTTPTEIGNFWRFDSNGNVIILPEYVPDHSEGLEFTSLGNGYCYVSGMGTCKDSALVIPSFSPDGDIVIGISDNAFYSDPISSVIIPGSVRFIGAYAFYSTSLTSVEIPEGVTSIGEGAFSYCRSLASVVIPDSMTSIANDAFWGCESLSSAVFTNTDGWWCYYGEDMKDETQMSSVSLADTASAAELLSSLYGDYYWYRK